MNIRAIALRKAAKQVKKGGVIAYPTEGVFGLGCDPFNEDAVTRILQLKGRPVEKGVILIASELSIFQPYLVELTDEQRQRMNSSWPGATTWVVPHNGSLPDWVTGGRDNVAIRVSGHPLARALCQRLQMPLVSTSANRSGEPAATTDSEVKQQLGSELDYVLTGKVLTPGQSSQIKDLITQTQYR